MERNDDERDLDPTNPQEPGPDIVGDAESEHGGSGPDATSQSDRSAEPQPPATSSSLPATDPSADDPEEPGPRQEFFVPTDAVAMQPDEQATRIELSLDPDVSPAARPPSTTGDQRSRVPPLDPGEQPEGVHAPVGQTLPPAPGHPADSSRSARTAKLAAVEQPRESIGSTVPRVQVLVMLLESKAMYADAIDEALDENAAKYRQIAQSEVDQAFWIYETERRAADWRLRDP